MALIWTVNVNYQPTRTAHFVRIHMYYIYIWGLPMKVQALELEYQELRKQINQQPLLGRI